MDLIQAELIKKGSPDLVECMYQLIIKIWITKPYQNIGIGVSFVLYTRRET
jgi:hypothetical protein